MPELADVFRRHGPAYMEKHGRNMLPSHFRAMSDIVNCRTEVLGGHVLVCDRCAEKHYSYHSCKNRACPKCQGKDTEVWIEKRKNEILPVPYFHVTMTLPEQWRPLVRSNQKDLYDILMKAAAAAIIKLAADPKHVGGQVGVMAVLHTWSRDMHYHPHVHCLVTGGGVSPDGKHWLAARDGYLFPKKAVSPIFRGIFIDMVRRKRPDLQIPAKGGAKKWVAHVKEAGYGTSAVLDYLGRYVHRVAINNSQIKEMDDSTVTFTYTENNGGRKKSMTLKAEEFIRRFLQHVPPKGFHKIRYYGLWSTAKRQTVKNTRLIMLLTAPESPAPKADVFYEDSGRKKHHPLEGQKCPHCGQGRLVYYGSLSPICWIRAP